MASKKCHVIIVGAGMAGLGLALALHTHDIKCTIYEQAPASGRFAGAINLSPNSLRILDKYGLHDDLLTKGFSFEYIEWQNDVGQSVDKQYLGSKKLFGYDALRIYRNEVIRALLKAATDRGIAIRNDRKFVKIISETHDSATIAFEDGTEATGNFVIAADGIHSKVRTSLFPDIVATYNGMLVVAGSVPRSAIDTPARQSLANPVTQLSPAGAFIIAAQKTDGSEVLAGTQRKFPEQDRMGWDKLAHDLALQRNFLENGIENRSPLMQSAIKNITANSIYIWPQRVLPHLPRWRSELGRIIIIGDAAHAIPPLTGQGANQAFEDGYTLAAVLARQRTAANLLECLDQWQNLRQERMDRVLELTKKVSNMWLGPEEKAKLSPEDIWKFDSDAEKLRWMYEPDIEGAFRDYFPTA